MDKEFKLLSSEIFIIETALDCYLDKQNSILDDMEDYLLEVPMKQEELTKYIEGEAEQIRFIEKIKKLIKKIGEL